TMIGVLIRIIPATLNTIMRAPPCSQAQRRVPGPLSAKLVTTSTFPPRPPKLYLPPPSAPGNAGMDACGRSVGRAAQGIYGLPFLASRSTIGYAIAHAESDFRYASFIIAAAASCSSFDSCGY